MTNKESIDNELYDEILLFLHYSVEEEKLDSAKSYVKKYKHSPLHMNLCKGYYTALPEAREEPLLGAVVLDVKQGVYLLGVFTDKHEYLYCLDSEQAVYIGEFEAPEKESDVWSFFEYGSVETFLKERKAFKEYPEFLPPVEDKAARCLVCGVAEGEIHHFGCPIEICPWCDGQLNRCNCRFDKLGVFEILTENELATLLELLEDKGRIPFKKSEGVAYPIAGDDKLTS